MRYQQHTIFCTR